ncbi:MAG: UDP-glucose 4-epimerase GalE [Clostridiales bacterium]|nr:UDP-glucose 4-epimerase GalE [Clostridiales bacterium]
MSILITGGAGYIGSHTCVELLDAGYEITVLDNYCNSCPEALERVKKITGKDFKYYECDIRDAEGLDKIFKENNIEAVIHFAGLKAVGESCQKPLEYYANNIGGTLTMLEVMRSNNCKKIVFSSSATVYGAENPVPFVETMKTGTTTNPYGTTKLYIETILQDISKADDQWSVVLLRYFNPVGAHESGLIGEAPSFPNNLMPYISQVAVGKRECLSVYGDCYDTPDGTGVRDYIHVVDLAKGHVKAIEYVMPRTGVEIFNLGTGNGVSVLELVKAFEDANNIKIPYKIVEPRAGDIAYCYSNPEKAYKVLGWKAEKSVKEMCEDTWRWQKNNPDGYN